MVRGKMTDKRRLPDTRFGAGLLTKLQDSETFVLPIRDAGAPNQPMRMDGQMGIKEKDESVEEAQKREGTEETAFVKENNGSTELGVPKTVKGTELEHNLVRTYKGAQQDADSPLPEIDDVFYFEASQEVPEGMPTMEAESGGYRTGYTWEVSDDISIELMNDNKVGFNTDQLVEGEISVYDLEYMQTDDGTVHFDRPTALLEPTEDEVAVFRSGELQYQGEVSGLRDFLSEEYGWSMHEVQNVATVKVGARLDAYDSQLGNQSAREFVNEEYMESLSELGEMFRNFPSL